jgi:hypothetical protein
MKRRTLTRHTVCCPLDGCTAVVTVRTHPGARSSRRHRDVATCSLLPATPFRAPARSGYFPDVAPPVSYACDVDSAPQHASGVTCPKPCLTVLNAEDHAIAQPVRCTSGVCDALELARRTQTPAILRVLWSYAG